LSIENWFSFTPLEVEVNLKVDSNCVFTKSTSLEVDVNFKVDSVFF